MGEDEESYGGEKNLAAWLYGVNDIRIEPYVALPARLGRDDVRVQIKAVGICGSDVHYLKHMRCGGFVVKEPMVIGHESAGTVLEVGDGVRHVRPGDDVALEPGVGCYKCIHCKIGSYNLCPDMAFFATPPAHGSLANVIIHPAGLCFKIPEGVSLEEGAMCEPLSVGVHACRRAGITVGSKVAIIGAGPIGLVCLLIAKAFGATKVVVADMEAARLDMAHKLGATGTLRVVSKLSSPSSGPLKAAKHDHVEVTEAGDDVASALRSLLAQDADVALDCVGMESTMRAAIAVTRSGGRVCMVGLAAEEMTLPIASACVREVDIVGVFRYRHTYPLCLELIASKRVDVKSLITHRFAFTQEDVEKAFEASARGQEAIKVMFNL